MTMHGIRNVVFIDSRNYIRDNNGQAVLSSVPIPSLRSDLKCTAITPSFFCFTQGIKFTRFIELENPSKVLFRVNFPV